MKGGEGGPSLELSRGQSAGVRAYLLNVSTLKDLLPNQSDDKYYQLINHQLISVTFLISVAHSPLHLALGDVRPTVRGHPGTRKAAETHVLGYQGDRLATPASGQH